MKQKFWIVHGGSDSYFAAKDVNDAWEVVKVMNKIAMEYDAYPTSKVECVNMGDIDDVANHTRELKVREKEGDDFYFQP